MARRKNDVKAPDGFLLGGFRLVRADGTILFQRGWWKAPRGWVGCRVWVHCTDGGAGDLEAAPPGFRVHEVGAIGRNYFLKRTERQDARSGARTAWRKAYEQRLVNPDGK